MLISNAPLNFQGTNEWFSQLGFDYIEGGESEAFAKFPRFSFNSPADEVLYKRETILINDQKSPYFIVLLTISLHSPYILPDEMDNKTNNPLINQLAYVDRTTKEFYDFLRKNRFFEDGILLLIGDHRRMTPLEPEEFRELGINSHGSIIVSFIGKGVRQGVIDNTLLSQTDISVILQRLVQGDSVFEKPLWANNRGSLLVIPDDFVTEVINEDYGLILVRSSKSKPWRLTMHGSMNALTISKDKDEQQIAAYLQLSGGWLEEHQKESNR